MDMKEMFTIVMETAMANLSEMTLGHLTSTETAMANLSDMTLGHLTSTPRPSYRPRPTKHPSAATMKQFNRAAWVYIAPTLLVLGLLSNLMSLIVLQTRHFRKTSSRFLLSALAVVDTLTLYTGLLRHFIIAVWKIDVRMLSPASCRTHIFLTYLYAELAAFTLLLMTLERLISVILPLRARTLCSRKRCIIAWVLMATALAAVNSHFFWSMDHQTVEKAGRGKRRFNVTKCTFTDDSKDFHQNVWVYIDFLLKCAIPFVVIAIANVVILSRVLRSQRFRSTLHRARGSQTQNNNINNLTVTLVVVSITFLLTTTPVGVFLIVRPYIKASTHLGRLRRQTVYRACAVLYYINNTINFLLYCVTGSKFRAALRDLCRRRYLRRTARISSSSGITTRRTSLSSLVASFRRLRKPSTGGTMRLQAVHETPITKC